MKAEILAVGTELLMGQVINTNAAEIAQMLAEIGIGVYHQTVVGDNPERLSDALRTAMRRVDLLVVCGGLGPTEDDLTRETLAELLGRPLILDREWEKHLHELFARHGWTPPEGLPKNNLRQAMVPQGATLLPNARGSAPGIYLEDDGTTVVLIPGPPREMRGLMREEVLPRLLERMPEETRGSVLRSRVLRVIGVGESRAAELLEEILATQSNPTIAPLAQLGEMSLRLTAHAGDVVTAQRLLDESAARIYAVLGDAIYGEDETTLEIVVGRLLTDRGWTVATAESCTGGLVADRLTNVPGSSRYMVGGVVAYSNGIKERLLSVDRQLFLQDGAVSEAVALAMAGGARVTFGSDVAVAITGIAGPGGGSEEKPVGLTYIAVADHSRADCRRFLFSGSREDIKARAGHTALEMLRQLLLS